MRALALIPLMEYDVLFSSILVSSLIFGFIQEGSSFVIHSVAFLKVCSSASRICSSVFSPSVCMKKKCSSPAVPEKDVVNSKSVVCMVCNFSRILKRILSETFSASLERNSSAVLIEPTMCVIPKISFNKYLDGFRSDGRTASIWRKCVTVCFSIRTILGFDASHKMCAI